MLIWKRFGYPKQWIVLWAVRVVNSSVRFGVKWPANVIRVVANVAGAASAILDEHPTASTTTKNSGRLSESNEPKASRVHL